MIATIYLAEEGLRHWQCTRPNNSWAQSAV